jgi:hypothetical protein
MIINGKKYQKAKGNPNKYGRFVKTTPPKKKMVRNVVHVEQPLELPIMNFGDRPTENKTDDNILELPKWD